MQRMAVYAILKAPFQIEYESNWRKTAPMQGRARGFIGIAFGSGQPFEYIYLRRRMAADDQFPEHTTQYAAHPDIHFDDCGREIAGRNMNVRGPGAGYGQYGS